MCIDWTGEEPDLLVLFVVDLAMNCVEAMSRSVFVVQQWFGSSHAVRLCCVCGSAVRWVGLPVPPACESVYMCVCVCVARSAKAAGLSVCCWRCSFQAGRVCCCIAPPKLLSKLVGKRAACRNVCV